MLNNARPITPVALVSGSGNKVNPIRVPAKPPSWSAVAPAFACPSV